MTRKEKVCNVKKVCGIEFHTIKLLIEQDLPPDITVMEKLSDGLRRVLEKIHKENEEEKVIVDIWCHFGHAYITRVGEGEQLCLL